VAEPVWVQQQVPLDWYTRYGLRADQMRLPKDASKREALARQVGVDGSQLLDAVWAATSAPYLRSLPAVEVLRQMWVQQYYRCSVLGMPEVRWSTPEGARSKFPANM
jgi:transposase